MKWDDGRFDEESQEGIWEKINGRSVAAYCTGKVKVGRLILVCTNRATVRIGKRSYCNSCAKVAVKK